VTTTAAELARQLAEDVQLQTDSSRATGRLARTYAEALLAVAEGKGQADDIGEQFQTLLRDVFPKSPELEGFLSSPAVNRARKEAVLPKLFEKSASPLFLDFLQVLNRKDRLGLLKLIGIAYRNLRDERANRTRVLVETAAPLSPAQTETLVQTLTTILGKTPVLVVRETPELIGGMVVRAGDKVFDTSVRSQLTAFRNQLTARGTHEIQSRRDRFCS
jgi:F-type H+-transporting ATPase subunit delta